MTVLSDHEIRQEMAKYRRATRPEEAPSNIHLPGIGIDPIPLEMQIQPCSVDLVIGRVGAERPEPPLFKGAIGGSGWVLPPGAFVLASTLEHISMPRDLVGKIEGKSSWAREGLMVEAAGLVDPCFRGYPTLELKNLRDTPLWIPREATICQILFMRLTSPADRPYGHPDLDSHYQDQGPDPTSSWMEQERRRTA